MDSLNKARDLQEIYKRLSWQIPVLKGSSPNRKLEMLSLSTSVQSPKSPHSLTFRLSAQIPENGHGGIIHMNDPEFLAALARAITNKLPSLVDDALSIIGEMQVAAFLRAEEDVRKTQERLESLRPELKEQRELL